MSEMSRGGWVVAMRTGATRRWLAWDNKGAMATGHPYLTDLRGAEVYRTKAAAVRGGRSAESKDLWPGLPMPAFVGVVQLRVDLDEIAMPSTCQAQPPIETVVPVTCELDEGHSGEHRFGLIRWEAQ